MPSDQTSGDFDTRPSSRFPEPDAHGQAALLLAESVLHLLVETGTLTIDQAIDAVRTASEVKVAVAEELGESAERMTESLGLLSRVELSLEAIDRSTERGG